MRDSLVKLQKLQKIPLTESEIKQHEINLYQITGKALIHPNEFTEIYVRDAVKKHIDNKFRKGKQ